MIELTFKLIRRAIIYIILGLLIYAGIQYSRDAWTKEQFRVFGIQVLKYSLPILALLYMFYKQYLERIILWINRKNSAEVIAEKLNHINQVSGAVRKGKDASTVGAAIIVKENILAKEKKELGNLQNTLYIYDFEKLHSWLNAHGSKYFVAGEFRINIVFSNMIRENQCFISQYWINKGVNPKTHYFYWKHFKNKRVLDYSFNDGLTPGGKPFLDMLRKYVILYVYHNFIPNFIMSNQPILESFEIIDRTKIERLFSKKLSQDYFKLKEETPIPLPMRGFIIETETAILYSNTDKTAENENKQLNGIREFYTTAGHILREKVFLYGITQSPTRVMKAMRELYPGFQHIFKMKFRSTSNFKRSFINFRIFLKKFKVIRIRIRRWITLTFKHKIINRKKGSKQKTILYSGRTTKKIYKIRRKISKLNSKEVRLFNNGYVEFYKGIYDNIADVGKKVKFPKVGVILESKSDSLTYSAYGFRQVNKITDTFMRYDTHFLKFIREEKEKVHNMHFNEVPNWESFILTILDAKFMNYKPILEMLGVTIKALKDIEKDKKKEENIKNQREATKSIPDFIKLLDEELISLAKDYGIDMEKIDFNTDTWRAQIMRELSSEWKKLTRREVL